MNTNANPGSILDAERATRIPYQSMVSQTTCSGISQCQFSGFSAPPSGYRLVIENVSGFFALNTSSSPIAGYLVNLKSLSQVNYWGLNAPLGQPFSGAVFSGLNQNVVAYFDAGDAPPFVNIWGNFFTGGSQSVNLSGHLENCALTGCPAIQH